MMKNSDFSFTHLVGGRDEFEESFWPSFTDVMMVITMIFLIVTVAVVLTNTRLMDELRHSVASEQSALQEARRAAEEALQASRQAQKAEQLAEFQLKANASLEEQLDYLQQRISSLEMELLHSRATAEAVANERDALSSRLAAQQSEYANTLALREQSIAMLQAELDRKNAEITGLTHKVDQSEKQLLSLQGEYTELDQKYQKLLKPARSSKGKTVVEVVYSKSGYSIRKPDEATLRSVGRAALEAELSALKAQYGNQLYVKVVIPDNSGLSYNEAWRFTNEMLTKYDYYAAP